MIRAVFKLINQDVVLIAEVETPPTWTNACGNYMQPLIFALALLHRVGRIGFRTIQFNILPILYIDEYKLKAGVLNYFGLEAAMSHRYLKLYIVHARRPIIFYLLSCLCFDGSLRTS